MSSISNELLVFPLSFFSVLRILQWHASCRMKEQNAGWKWIYRLSRPRSSRQYCCGCRGFVDCSSTRRSWEYTCCLGQRDGRQQPASVLACIGSVPQWYECSTRVYLFHYTYNEMHDPFEDSQTSKLGRQRRCTRFCPYPLAFQSVHVPYARLFQIAASIRACTHTALDRCYCNYNEANQVSGYGNSTSNPSRLNCIADSEY